MNKLQERAAHKEDLGRRIAAQRGRLAAQVQALQPLFAVADRGANLARSLVAHRAWLGLALGVLLALRLRRPRPRVSRAGAGAALRWLRRGLLAWRGGTLALTLLRHLVQAKR